MSVKDETAPRITASVQWNGRGYTEVGGPPDWLLAAIRKNGTPDKVVGTAMRMHDEVHVGTRFGVMVARRGDWFVLHEDGEIGVLSDYEYQLSRLLQPAAASTTP